MTEDQEHRLAALEARLDQNDADLLKLAQELLGAIRSVNDQRLVIRGLMDIMDTAFTMNRILHERLDAVEKHLKGFSMQDIIDGKVPPPVGPTPEHFQMLRDVTEKMNRAREEFNRERG